MSQYKRHEEDSILLTEAGFIAVNQMDEDAALKLFKAAELLNAKSTLPQVGIGYLHLHKLDLKEACKAFDAVVKRDPHNEMAKTLYGLALGLSNETSNKGEKILHETAQGSRDPMLKQLGDTAIAFIDRFVKRTPGPASGDMKRK